MNLGDPVSERGVLSGLCQHGSVAYLDVIDMLQPETFTVEFNQVLYQCLKNIFDKDETAQIDGPSIIASANELSFGHHFTQQDVLRHLNAIMGFRTDLTNVRKFASKIRKLQITRLMQDQLDIAKQKLGEVTGAESVLEIIGIAEDQVFDFSSLLHDDDNAPILITEGLRGYLEYLSANPVDQMGICTGFHAFDKAIGGGPRDGTVTVIGARTGVGKTLLSDNMGYFIAKTMPVLNMDTEMLAEDHMARLTAMVSGVAINDIETGQFSKNAHSRAKVEKAVDEMEKTKLFHKSIAGKPFEEQIAIMRKWITQEVGLNPDGSAKPCCIMYDYLKLMTADGMSADMKEYQLLGFMMTTLHNFSVRYKVPVIAFIQLNRDGINKESTDAASGSDRIVWLCTSFTIFKNKSDEEMAEDNAKGGKDHGNRKLVVLKARHGGGMEGGNYINCMMTGWCGRIKEGKTKLEVEIENAEDDGFIVDDEDVQL